MTSSRLADLCFCHESCSSSRVRGPVLGAGSTPDLGHSVDLTWQCLLVPVMEEANLLEGQHHFSNSLMASKLADRSYVWCISICHPSWQDIAQRRVLHQVKGHMEAFGVDLGSVCDLEDTLEANALLTNVSHCVLLGGAAHIAQRSDVALCEPHLARDNSLHDQGYVHQASKHEQRLLPTRCDGHLSRAALQGRAHDTLDS